MSCAVGGRHGSDPTLLWLWYRLEAVALIGPLAWEPPYAMSEALKRPKKKRKKKKKIKSCRVLFPVSLSNGRIVSKSISMKGRLISLLSVPSQQSLHIGEGMGKNRVFHGTPSLLHETAG